MMSDESLETELNNEVPADRARWRASARSELARAEACVAAMARHLPLGESEVIWCLEHDDWIAALATIAKLAGSDLARASKVFERGSVHGQLVLMRAAGLSWPVVEWILTERSAVRQSEMGLHRALYLSLPAHGHAVGSKSTEANSNVVQIDAARKRRAQLELAGRRQRP